MPKFLDVTDLGAAGQKLGVGGRSVVSYGATGDGTTDDTTAIHAARDAAGVGGTVLFPAGTYLANNLAANVANQTWELAPGAVIKMKTAATNAVYVTADNVTLSGGIFDCSNGTANDGSQHPVRIDGDGCTVRNVTIKDSPLYGIVGFNGNKFTVTGCTITNSWGPGIWVQNSTAAVSNIYDILITNNVVDNSAGGDRSSGIGLYGNSTTQRVNRAVIAGNIITLPYDQPPVDTGSIGAVNCSDFVVTDNVCKGGHIGISTPSAVRAVISNNTVLGFTGYGIELPGTNANVRIIGNAIDPDGQSGDSGITANTGTQSNITIAGNTITGMVPTGAVLIRFGSGSTVDGVSITGNTLRSAHSAYIGILSNGAVSNLAVSGNVFDGLSAANARAMEFLNAITGLTVSGNHFANLALGAVRVGTGSAVTQDYITLDGNGYVNCPYTILNSNYGSGSSALGSNLSVPRKVSVPGSASTAGFPGYWAADSSYIYTYTGNGTTHTWVRATATTW